MKLDSILAHIRSMRDRSGLSQVIHAAEARDAKLLTAESTRERARLWAKFLKLGIKVGDTVFIHTPLQTSTDKRGKVTTTGSGMHQAMWGKALTVEAIKARNKEVVVTCPSISNSGGVSIKSTVDYTLTAFTVEKLKLSLEPTPEALSNSLRQERTIAPKKGDTITIRRPIKFNVRGVI